VKKNELEASGLGEELVGITIGPLRTPTVELSEYSVSTVVVEE